MLLVILFVSFISVVPDWCEGRSCLAIWEPVCGTDGKVTKTFGNDCELGGAEGFWQLHEGECTEEELARNKRRGCPKIYSPVCGINDDRQVKTFSNDCELGNEPDFWQLHEGECTEEELARNKRRGCPKIYSPVCGINNDRQVKTFSNDCELGNEPEYSLLHEGACTESELKTGRGKPCTKDWRPVCAINEDEEKRTFPNQCKLDNSDKDWRYQGNGRCGV